VISADPLLSKILQSITEIEAHFSRETQKFNYNMKEYFPTITPFFKENYPNFNEKTVLDLNDGTIKHLIEVLTYFLKSGQIVELQQAIKSTPFEFLNKLLLKH